MSASNQKKPITSSLARKIEKFNQILLWLHQWGFTDALTVESLISVSMAVTYQTLKAMTKAGLIASTHAEGVPSNIYHLTPRGGRAAIELGVDDRDPKPIVFPSTIPLSCPAHDLMAQRYCLEWLSQEENKESYVLSSRQIRARKLEPGRADPKCATKIPDALLVTPVAHHLLEVMPFKEFRTALEIQQSYEHKDKRGHKLWTLFRACQNLEISGFIYLSTKPGLLDQYRQQWRHALVEYNYEGGWEKVGKEPIDHSEIYFLCKAQFLLKENEFSRGLYTLKR